MDPEKGTGIDALGAKVEKKIDDNESENITLESNNCFC